jgi:hypothetical protein
MRTFGDFHDGCLREAHIWTESFVDTEMRMSVASDLETRVRLLIQRQWRDPSAIELLFEEVTALHLRPSPQDYDWSLDSPKRDEVTWIAAKKLSWRDVSAWMGPNLHYGPGDAEI